MSAPQLRRGDDGFRHHLDQLVFNALPFGREPDVVVRPRDEAEVVEAVRAARAAGQRVAVLSGGHSWIGAPLRRGGVLLDLSALDPVEVDPVGRTVRVGPAARGGAVIRAVAEHGLAYPSGHCSTPGSGGYLLGGGIGLNSGQWGPACASVRSIRVVTAAGELLTASGTEHRELLWSARGAGPAFPGVVTSFEISLQDRPADTRISTWVLDLDHLAQVGRWVSEASASLPAHVEVFTATGGHARHDHLPADGYPEHVVTVVAMVFADDEEHARASLAPLAAGPGVPVLAHHDLEPVPFEQVSSGFDAEYPEGHRILADAFWTDQDVEGALAPVEEVFRRAPSGMSNVVALMLGNGRPVRMAEDDGAWSAADRTLVMAYALWQDPAADAANRAWMAEVSAVLGATATGNFVSEADHEAYPGHLPASFSTAAWARLEDVRSRWDPVRLFHRPGEGA